mgnify:CR=1 FL=1
MKKRTHQQIGRGSKKKGYQGEYIFRKLCEKYGLIVKWHNEDPYLPDVSLEGHLGEVKYRGNVPKCLYDWLDEKGAHFLAIKKVKKEPGGTQNDWLIVMRWDLFFKFLKQKEW